MPKARRLVRTSTPGVYKRGSRYVIVFRDRHGRQHKRSARTLAEARQLKAALTADVARGEFRALSRVSFAEYAPEWITQYAGRTRRGLREETRAEYRRTLGLDAASNPTGDGAVEFFGRMRLADIEPRDIKRYAAEVAARGVAADTVRLALAPVKALLATAVEEGIIRSNPSAGLRFVIPARDGEPGEPRAKALTEGELRALLEELSPEWRLRVQFLAQTGLRISEALALTWGDIDFGRYHVRIERRLRGGRVGSTKSSYSRRQVAGTLACSRICSGVRSHLRRQGRHPDRPDARLPDRESGGGARRRGRRRLAHAPPHGSDARLPERVEREAGTAPSGPPLAGIYSGHLRPLATGRPTGSNFSRLLIQVGDVALEQGGAGGQARKRLGRDLSADPAREPPAERTEYQPGLERERNVGGHAYKDAEC